MDISENKVIEQNQDKKQRLAIMSQFGIEFYKILTGCFLLFFVPQECDGHTCTMNEISHIESPYYQTTLYFNGATFLSFLVLYYVELNRENTLIKYLEVNPEKARDNDSVGLELEKLENDKRDQITYNRILYNNVGKVCATMFMINSILSGTNLYQHQLGSKTISVYFTNILFTATKLGNIYDIVCADKNVFLSSYMTRKVQYNDVDPDHLLEDIEESTSRESDPIEERDSAIETNNIDINEL
jgi:hypothetical protein